ncbi:hypothetical protein N7488_004979 [Penicillium malachiteum]|nr:hypothetical protein N7488_004979 [Penicillium malachiteum]
MSTPEPRDRRSLRNAGVDINTPSGDTTLTRLQRLPTHTRYPLTPSRLAIATPSLQRSSRFTPRVRGIAAPATPHGLRARQQRAVNTPGHDRRRSGKVQRETTFDILRNLGRALAPISHPIQSSPQEAPEYSADEIRDEIEELDNEPEIEPPRLSLNIQESEDGSEKASSETPPRMSLAFDDDDITYQSVEYPRDISIRDHARLSMMPGVGRHSENFGEIQLDSESDSNDETGVLGGEEVLDDTMTSGGEFDQGGETEDLGRFHIDFNFPSPTAAPIDDEPEGDMDGFELSAGDVESLAHSSPPGDDNAGGDFAGSSGLSLVPSSFRSQSPGLIGGGLRDEGLSVLNKMKKLSRSGTVVPNLPTGVVKKLAMRFSRKKAGSKTSINKVTLAAIEQASSWFFEQTSNDLAGYSAHAQRKMIDESDVIMLMRRQRHINNSTTVFSLAQRHLPKELQQDMRLAMPP